MAGDSDAIIKELVKLNTKLTILCEDVSELKAFHKDTIQRLTNLSDRIENLEKWKEEFYNFSSEVHRAIVDMDKRLSDIEKWKNELKIERREKKRFSRDTITAIASGFAGGVASALAILVAHSFI